MKKIILLLLTSFVLLTGCEKQVSLTPPTIISLSNNEALGEEILFEVIEYAEIDNKRILPEKYDWEITRISNHSNPQIPDSTYDNRMTWTPQDEGNYIVSVTILYDGNKTIKAIKEVEIDLTAAFLQSKLAGTWVGKYTFNGFQGSEVRIIIDESGHFIGHTISGPSAAMYWGANIDLHCAKIQIEELQNGVGKGEVQIPFTGNYCCEFPLDDLAFFLNYDSLVFQVIGSTQCNFDGSIQQHLKRK